MRAFIAVPIGDAVKKKVSAFSKALSLAGVSVVPPENMHVTLFFLGEIGERRAGDVSSALEKIAVPKFTLKFSGVGAFPNENFIRVAWVGCESRELNNIYEELSPSIASMGYRPEPFRAHLTVARVKSPEAKEEVKAALEKFKGKDFGSGVVDEVALYESRLGKTPTYAKVYGKTLC